MKTDSFTQEAEDYVAVFLFSSTSCDYPHLQVNEVVENSSTVNKRTFNLPRLFTICQEWKHMVLLCLHETGQEQDHDMILPRYQRIS